MVGTVSDGNVLILTGPSGAGKTTIAQALTLGCQCPAVHLHADDFWRFIRHGLLAPHSPAARAQNSVVIDAVAAAASIYARGGYLVVVDGVIGPWYLERFRASINGPLHYVVLRPDIQTTLARASGRGGRGLTSEGLIEDAIRHLHMRFADLGSLECHAIDTTGQMMEETLKRVQEILKAGASRLPGSERSMFESQKPRTRGS